MEFNVEWPSFSEPRISSYRDDNKRQKGDVIQIPFVMLDGRVQTDGKVQGENVIL
jgi:hypothetical protein